MKAQVEPVKSGAHRMIWFIILLSVSIALMILGAVFKDLWWGKGFFFVSILLLVPILRMAFSKSESEEEQNKE